jgi:hypothetical protein
MQAKPTVIIGLIGTECQAMCEGGLKGGKPPSALADFHYVTSLIQALQQSVAPKGRITIIAFAAGPSMPASVPSEGANPQDVLWQF